jgi:signal transduction histidine kinase
VKLLPRPTVRARLALLLAVLVVVTGAVLLVASYTLTTVQVSGVGFGMNQAQGQQPPQFGGSAAQIAGSSSQVTVAIHHQVDAALSVLLAQYGAILAGLVVVAVCVAWLMAGSMLRPLRTITDAAQRIGRENLNERLALTGPDDELKELGDTFDSMLSRLHLAFQDQQLFAANAAHQLRTPLAVMRAELDLALTGPQVSAGEQHEMAVRLRRTVIACEQLTERLLSLTRGILAPEEREAVGFEEIVQRRLAAAEPHLAKRHLTLHQDVDHAVVHGEPRLLAELVDNLIDNATKYNLPGGWITVTTRTANGHVVLDVSNSGHDLVREDLSRLLEPFRRANQQRVGTSSGLGLSIVHTIVAAHDGQLALEALNSGGLRVRVSLPAIKV